MVRPMELLNEDRNDFSGPVVSWENLFRRETDLYLGNTDQGYDHQEHAGKDNAIAVSQPDSAEAVEHSFDKLELPDAAEGENPLLQDDDRGQHDD